MDTSGWNMYVFRDGRRILSGCDLVRSLRQAIDLAACAPHITGLTGALIAAGELACALSDVQSAYTPIAEEITDHVAGALVAAGHGDTVSWDRNAMGEKLGAIVAPEELYLSVQEGFAYYALHPLKFANVVERLTLPRQVSVVGIRSIGLTLSAVTLAKLRARGHDAQRITVRPTGHPYDRTVDLSLEQQAWVAQRKTSDFLVVDEGPGLSGSSFIATAEALLKAGISADRILLIGTRIPDVDGLRTPNAAARWARFRAVAIEPAPMLPDDAEVPMGGGTWRQRFFSNDGSFPGSWTQLERLKYLSGDHRRFYRFEGYGHYGAEQGERAKQVAAGGFGPEYFGNVEGFGCYEHLGGSPLHRSGATDAVLDRIAEYCAFRGHDFPEIENQPSELEQMLRFNWKTEFDAELEGDFSFSDGAMIVTDSRMMPYKWIRGRDGKVLKVDSTSHGDDHFFPGPCNIAWDLAGTIIEWGLSAEGSEHFLRKYERLSGDDPKGRIGKYLLAYSTLRLAYSRMAARAMGGTQEEPLLMREYERYRLQALAVHAQYFEGQTDTKATTAA